MKSKIVISLVLIILVAAGLCIFIYRENSENKRFERLSAVEIMEILKTDKDYKDLGAMIASFTPTISVYNRMNPSDYSKVRSQWIAQGLTDRTNIIDKLKLNDSIFWVELKNNNDGKAKGFAALIDVKEKKSLFLLVKVFMNINAGL